MGRRNTIAALATCLCVLCIAGPAHAGAPGGPPPQGPWDPRHGLTLGPSLAWVGGGELGDAFSAGVELSYYHVVHTPLALWISAGARLWTNGDETPVLPYGEVGIALLVVVAGAGYSAGLGSDAAPAHAVHGFFGLALPLWTPKNGHLLYLEPYYRPCWDVSGAGQPPRHELGVMLKWFFALGSDAKLSTAAWGGPKRPHG
jgi:hypothetical protein